MTDTTADESIARALEQAYGFRVSCIVRRRTVLGIVADDGRRFIFKPMSDRDDETRLAALAATRAIFQQAGVEAALPIANSAGRFAVRPVEAGMAAGYLQPWLLGQHIDLADREERICAIQSLARIQRQSIELGRPSLSMLHHSELLNKLRVKERAMHRIWPSAKLAYPLLGEVQNELFQRMSTAMQRYMSYLVRRQSASSHALAFCHRDLAPHNILWRGGGGVGLIDFDHASYDDMLHDAMQLIGHCVYLGRLTQDDFDDMLMIYAGEVGLSQQQLYLLRDLALWPDIAIRTVLELCRSGFPNRGQIRLAYALRQDSFKQQLVENSALSAKRLREV